MKSLLALLFISIALPVFSRQGFPYKPPTQSFTDEKNLEAFFKAALIAYVQREFKIVMDIEAIEAIFLFEKDTIWDAFVNSGVDTATFNLRPIIENLSYDSMGMLEEQVLKYGKLYDVPEFDEAILELIEDFCQRRAHRLTNEVILKAHREDCRKNMKNLYKNSQVAFYQLIRS